MATLPESPSYSDSVIQIETTDKVLGGPDGKINVQAKQLADRTAWLKHEVEAAGATASEADTKADSALVEPEVGAGLGAAVDCRCRCGLYALTMVRNCPPPTGNHDEGKP